MNNVSFKGVTHFIGPLSKFVEERNNGNIPGYDKLLNVPFIMNDNNSKDKFEISVVYGEDLIKILQDNFVDKTLKEPFGGGYSKNPLFENYEIEKMRNFIEKPNTEGEKNAYQRASNIKCPFSWNFQRLKENVYSRIFEPNSHNIFRKYVDDCIASGSENTPVGEKFTEINYSA